MEQKFKEWGLLLVNSVILIRLLLKENNQLLHKTNGMIQKKTCKIFTTVFSRTTFIIHINA